nr:tetratricopeptide repeat protein [Clostridium botulinum]
MYYKKILLIEPKLTFAKNKLGLVFFYDKQYEEAIIQFRELIQLNPHNSIFYNNLAYVYKEQRKYDLAEELLLKSYNIDSTNEKTVLALVDIYIVLGNYEKGMKFINKCIEENESDTFKEIMYYLKLIRIYVNINNINMVVEIFNKVKNIILDEEKVKEYVVWKLQKIAEELLKDSNYELGYNICEKLLQIDSKNEKILNLYNKFNEILKVQDLLKELSRDERVMECLKKPIIYYLHWNVNNEKEFNKKKKKI